MYTRGYISLVIIIRSRLPSMYAALLLHQLCYFNLFLPTLHLPLPNAHCRESLEEGRRRGKDSGRLMTSHPSISRQGASSRRASTRSRVIPTWLRPFVFRGPRRRAQISGAKRKWRGGNKERQISPRAKIAKRFRNGRALTARGGDETDAESSATGDI